MRRIEDYLLQHATTAGDRLAVVCGSEHITYARLCTLVQERARTLAGCGQKGLVLRSSQSIDFLVTYFAAHMADRAIVPLEKIFRKSVSPRSSLWLPEIPSPTTLPISCSPQALPETRRE